SADYEIFLYDGSQIMQLTYNDYDDFYPQIHNGMVTWYGFDGQDYEIFLYDGTQTIQLTNNAYDDINPQIHNGMVTWQEQIGNAQADTEIFLYDSSQTIRLTNDAYPDRYPQIHNGMVTWEGHDGHDTEIFLYDGTQTIQLTNNDNIWDGNPHIHNGMVTWRLYDDYYGYDEYGIYHNHDSAILFFDGTQIIELARHPDVDENDIEHRLSAPRIHNGMIVFYHRIFYPESLYPEFEIRLYDGNHRIGSFYSSDYPVNHGNVHNGEVVCTSGGDIFQFDETQTTQVTSGHIDSAPNIHSGEIVFIRDNTDIILARKDLTPPDFIAVPSDFTIECGQYFEVTWCVRDLETKHGIYELLLGRSIDGEPTISVGNGIWDNNNPFITFKLLREMTKIFLITETEEYVLKLVVYSGYETSGPSSSDDVLITITPDVTPPVFTPHNDIIVSETQGQWDMSWHAYEYLLNVTYEITIDGVFHDIGTILGTESFNSTGPILAAGDYLVECTFTDTVGNSASDSIVVTILPDTIPPIISNEQDIYMLEGDQEVIEWNVDELRPNIYQIFQDGILVKTEVLTDSISYDLSYLAPGNYEIKCTVWDLDGNAASDTVLVIVSGYLHWIFKPVDQILTYGEALDYQLAVKSIENIQEWWISDKENFNIISSYSEGISSSRIFNKTTLLPREYEIELLVTDMDGRTLQGSFIVIVQKTQEPEVPQMQLKLSGSFDYLLKEEINLQLACLLTDFSTGDPVTGASVTFDVYSPDGSILISGTFVEDTDPGVYIYTMPETMKDSKLPKGIYLVYARAIALDGAEAVDMIQFHIDPPGESPNNLLPFDSYFGLISLLAWGILIIFFAIRRQRNHKKRV
ncbi:MAG: hypothetical protein ACFE96_10775, partial [Candidatus Hermodarchaeota archaeon]